MTALRIRHAGWEGGSVRSMAPKTFRPGEVPGRLWLAAYLVPAACVALGIASAVIEHRLNRSYSLDGPGLITGVTLALSTGSAIGLGLASILRGEGKSYYAYQPLVTAWLVLLFAAIWAVTLKG